MRARPKLQTDFPKLAQFLGRTTSELAEFTRPFDGKILLATEESTIAYLEEKDDEQKLKFQESYSSCDGIETYNRVIDLDRELEEMEGHEVDEAPQRRMKPLRPYVSRIDSTRQTTKTSKKASSLADYLLQCRVAGATILFSRLKDQISMATRMRFVNSASIS